MPVLVLVLVLATRTALAHTLRADVDIAADTPGDGEDSTSHTTAPCLLSRGPGRTSPQTREAMSEFWHGTGRRLETSQYCPGQGCCGLCHPLQ